MRETTLISLNKHLNCIFVETGTADGAAIDMAIAAGFKKIYSIEIEHGSQSNNLSRFKDIINVELITGDSAIEMEKLMPRITERATFWLDAHFEVRGTVGLSICPLCFELNAISKSAIKDHTIMIDDMRVIGKKHWGRSIVKDELIRLIKKINPEYHISYEDNTIVANDIMVAEVLP
jgi:hypothetical protein